MGIIKQSIKIVVWLARLAYLGLAIVIIFLAAYYFGKSLLFELKGGDTAAALSLVYWFDHWFPKIPLWFPSQGGGVSYVYGYQFMAHLFVVLLHRLSSLTLEQAYQLLGFLSIPLTSLGIYFFVWTRLKNQTAAFLSAFFYFLSPITWVWLIFWGFFGESISYMFIPPLLIFFDLFLSSVLEGRLDFKARLWFLLAILFLILLWFTHSIAFLGMLFFFPFYALLYPLLSAKTERLKMAFLGILAVLVFFASTYLLSALQMVHFQYYGLQTKTAGSASKEFFLKDAREWYLKPFLSLGDIPIENRRYAERNVAFAPPVWALAILGLASSFWLSKKLFVVGLYSALSFLFIFYPDPIWKILNLTGAQHYRPLIVPLRIFLPILAAFGAAAIPYFFWRLVFLWRKLSKKLSLLLLPLEQGLVALSTLVLGVVAVILFRYYATPPPTVRYGPETLNFELVDDSGWPYLCHSQEKVFTPSLCNLSPKPKINSRVLAENCFAWRLQGKPIFDFCQEEASEEALAKLVASCESGQIEKEKQGFCQALVEPLSKTLDLTIWPRPTIVGGDALSFMPDIYRRYLALKEKEEMVRIDISPNLGPVTQAFNLDNFSDSTLSLHGYQSSLNHSYWGYQQNIFYGKKISPTSVYNVARWFGVEFVLVNQDADPVENFQQEPDNWEAVAPGIFRFKKGTGLYSFSAAKPTYLVIGNESKAAYETVFRTANEGALSYDDGFLVQGKENIDDYSSSQLKQFDAIILFGYSYRNPRKAFRLLDEYVKDGGNLFISTGWQYVDKDWEIEKAPDFFPVKDLVWSTTYNKNSRYLLEDEQMGEVNVLEFSPLIWGDQAWGISEPATGIRDWAKTILSVDGKPLVVAGNFGRGKVIWTGLNWMGHIASFGFNQEEIKFLNQLLKSFFSGKPKDTNEKEGVVIKRDFPDKVEFTFENDSNGGTLYLRESYHPDWKAHLVSNGRKRRLPIYKAGPLYKLVKLPPLSSQDQLVFEYDNGVRGFFATLISLLTFTLLILYLILGKKVTNQFTDLVRIGKGSISEKVRSTWKEEE